VEIPWLEKDEVFHASDLSEQFQSHLCCQAENRSFITYMRDSQHWVTTQGMRQSRDIHVLVSWLVIRTLTGCSSLKGASKHFGHVRKLLLGSCVTEKESCCHIL
jgi:hypothetical protein